MGGHIFFFLNFPPFRFHLVFLLIFVYNFLLFVNIHNNSEDYYGEVDLKNLKKLGLWSDSIAPDATFRRVENHHL